MLLLDLDVLLVLDEGSGSGIGGSPHAPPSKLEQADPHAPRVHPLANILSTSSHFTHLVIGILTDDPLLDDFGEKLPDLLLELLPDFDVFCDLLLSMFYCLIPFLDLAYFFVNLLLAL